MSSMTPNQNYWLTLWMNSGNPAERQVALSHLQMSLNENNLSKKGRKPLAGPPLSKPMD